MNLCLAPEGEKEPAMSDFKDCSDQEPCSGPEPLKTIGTFRIGGGRMEKGEKPMIIHSGSKGLNPSNNMNYNFP